MKRRRASGDAELVLVNMHPVKEWAITKLGSDSILRKTLEREQETILANDFVAKLGVWLQLLEIEDSRR